MPPKRYFEAAEEPSGSARESVQDIGASAKTARGKGVADPSAGATLFVSRLPYTATSTDLSTLFSDIGPLKRAFVVTDPETRISKGVGYVSFAIREDAVRALETLQGRSLDGGKRKIQVDWAENRKLLGKDKGNSAEDAEATSRKHPRVESGQVKTRPAPPAGALAGPAKDPDAVRTLVLSGLKGATSAVDNKSLYKRARKIGDVERVVYPAPSATSSEPDADAAHVVYRIPNHAATAVSKLHAHTFKGALLSAVLKKRADGAARLTARMRPETAARKEKIRQALEAQGVPSVTTAAGSVGDVNRSSRLIVRNLPFDITEADLRAVFLPYGPIYSIDVPQKADEPGRHKQTASDSDSKSGSSSSSDEESGYDSNAEEHEDDAESDEDFKSAEEGSPEANSEAGSSNPHDVLAQAREETDATATLLTSQRSRGRGFAFVWMVSRSDATRALDGVNGRTLARGAAEAAVLKAAKGQKGRQLARANKERVQKAAQPGRVVAVDWALSKKKWEEKAAQSETETDAEDDEDDDEDDDEEDDEEDEGSDLEPIAVGDADEQDDEESEEEKGPQKPALPAPEEGTTLFVRNLAYEATEEELRNVFRSFGPLRYARITMDKTTGRSRGTGFVCFWQRESADAALERAQLVEREARSGSNATPVAAGRGSNPFVMPSVLTADPSAPLTASLNLHGRVLNVTPAVPREQAGKLADQALKGREKQDKRNTWLMREGVPFPNSPLAASLPPGETEKRLQSFTVRRGQLNSNPSLYISKTRLSVRQLPLYVTDRTLKRLAIHAIRTFESEVSSGARTGLTTDELADATLSAAARPTRRGERPTAVCQTKVVRQMERVDPLTGAGRSRGYGFLEMRTFKDALRVLRWANANKAVASLMFQWWTEELGETADRLRALLGVASDEMANAKGEEQRKKPKRAPPVGPPPSAEERVELEARLKRIQKTLAELKAGAKVDKSERGGLILVEFSIENVTVTKKRSDRATAQREGAQKRKERDVEAATAGDESEADEPDEAPATEAKASKRARQDNRSGRDKSKAPRNRKLRSRSGDDVRPAPAASAQSRAKGAQKIEGERNSDKLGSRLGGAIGKKRKMRKEKRKGGK